MDIVSKAVNHNSHQPGNVTSLSGHFSSDPPESSVLWKFIVVRLVSFARSSPGRVPEDVKGRVRAREASC